LVVCLVIGVLCSSIIGEETSVFTLTDTNFDELTAKGKWLVEFYAPWCGHCQKLAPIYDQASLNLKSLNSELKLGKVDCTVETGLANRFDIKGYPTMKYMRSGITTPYEGGRTLESIMEFARRATKKAVEEISEDGLDKFWKSNTVAFLLVGGSDLAMDVFVSIAQKLQESVAFGKAPASLKSNFNQKESGFVVLLNDDEPQVYQGSFKEEDLVEWVLKNRFPLFVELGPSNFQTIANNGKLTVISVIDPSDTKSTAYLEMMRTVAKKNKQNFSFGYINGVEYNQFVARHGVSTMPNFFVLDSINQNYRETTTIVGPHTEEKVNSYLQDVLAGKIEAKGLSGLSQVFQFIQTNLMLVLAGVAVVIVAIVFCCCVGSSDSEVPIKRE